MAASRRFILALIAACAVAAPGAALAQSLSGAGSTLIHPLLSQWSRAYQKAQSDPEFQPVAAGIDYEPIGSQAGLMRLHEGDVDFAVSEMPLSPEELTRYGFGQFPLVLGGVTVAVNLAGVESGRLKLTGEVLAEIFLGEVKSWADPRLKALNPDLSLPDAPIAVIRREDGSGTSFNFTNYLSGQSPRWKEKVGQGLTVAWPVGRGAKGNERLAQEIKRTPGAIGYVDFAQARRTGVALAQLRNRAGNFVAPGTEGFRAAAAHADWATAPDFGILLNDAPGADAYPIVATAFAIVRRDGARGARAATAFLGWTLDNGAATASDLGYVPLPPNVVAATKAYWASNLKLGL